MRVNDRLVWIDCEMTGLDIERDALIEIACLVTDAELNLLDEGVDLIIKPPAEALESMPDVVREMHTASRLLAELPGGIAVTEAQELVLGYVIGVAGGVVGGYALGRSPRLAAIFEPYVMAFYGVPKIALAPLFIIWFGIGMGSKVALASIMVFFLVFYNVFAGVRSVDRELVNLTLVMGANQRQLTYHVYLPAAAPFVMLGMRMAIPYSVIGVIVGEFTSSTQGLGLFIHEASATYDPAGVFAGIVILLGFVVVAGSLADRLERRLLRWRNPSGLGPSDI